MIAFGGDLAWPQVICVRYARVVEYTGWLSLGPPSYIDSPVHGIPWSLDESRLSMSIAWVASDIRRVLRSEHGYGHIHMVE